MCLCTRCEQCHIVLSNSPFLIRRTGFPDPDNGLHVLHFAECGLPDRSTLILFYSVMLTKQVDADSKVAETRQLEERMPIMNADMEGLLWACAHINEFTVEQASSAASSEQAQVARDALANCIRKPEFNAAMSD